MTPSAALLAHLGPWVAHVTARSNLPSIIAHGLKPAAALAREANLSPDDIILRRDRMTLTAFGGTVTLNHQKPILHGPADLAPLLDGHTKDSWSTQLDERVFLWPGRKSAAFRDSIAADTPTAILELSTARLIDALGHRLHLSPINSGNFRQGGSNARRGDWIYVPATLGLQAFRDNRRNRGLIKNRDSVKELSFIGEISAETLSYLMRQADEA